MAVTERDLKPMISNTLSTQIIMSDDEGTPYHVSSEGEEATLKQSSSLSKIHRAIIKLAAKKNYYDAVKLCQKTIADLEEALGHEHPNVATMMNVLALIFRDMKEYAEATPLLYKVLEIRNRRLGVFHPSLAGTLNNMAVLHWKQENYEEAEQWCQLALLSREGALGHDHPLVVRQMNNLARVCQQLGKFAESEQYFCRSLEICQRIQDSSINRTKFYLGSLYAREGKLDQAEQLFKEVISAIHDKDYRVKGDSKSGHGSGEGRHSCYWSRHTAFNEEGASARRLGSEDKCTLLKALKYLREVYKVQNRVEAADTLAQAINHLLSKSK